MSRQIILEDGLDNHIVLVSICDTGYLLKGTIDGQNPTSVDLLRIAERHYKYLVSQSI